MNDMLVSYLAGVLCYAAGAVILSGISRRVGRRKAARRPEEMTARPGRVEPVAVPRCAECGTEMARDGKCPLCAVREECRRLRKQLKMKSAVLEKFIAGAQQEAVRNGRIREH